MSLENTNYRYTNEVCRIIEKKEIGIDIYDFLLLAPKIVKVAKPGQFVNILCDEKMLRRPISLCGINREEDTIRIVFEVKGEGTRWMSKRCAGHALDLTGPHGKGFPLLEKAKKVILVGGGIGAPPLVPVAEFYKNKAVIITGFRNKDVVILCDDFKHAGAENIVCTDDSSLGIGGFTPSVLEDYLKENSADVIYTCGPKIMMKKIAQIAQEKNIRCIVSLEERMACGVGACYGCVCKTKTRDGTSKEYRRICLNGPIFEADEVVWDE